MNKTPNSPRSSKRKFGLEERRSYYIAWKKSELNTTDFCKTHGISKSAIYQWNREFKEENTVSEFSPLIFENSPAVNQADKIRVTVEFQNPLQLTMEIPADRLVSFIQEMGHATAVVR